MPEKKEDVLQFDKRVMHRYVAEGKMTSKDLEKHLEKLPDLTEECDDISEMIYGDKR